jgi:hypothetical protein
LSEEGKWAKVTGWGDKAEAQRILLAAIDRYKGKQPDAARRRSRVAEL